MIRDAGAVERLAVETADRVRAAVVPRLGDPGARVRVGVAPGGDTTMAIDEVAERVVTESLREAGDVAFFSEDQGYVAFGTPRAILVVDPVDGTRPAAAGLESCCVSIAVVPPDPDATLGDVAFGVVQELKEGTRFVARRGGGTRVERPDGSTVAVAPSANTDLRALFWTAGLRGRPAVPMAVALAELIDGSSMRGGFFDLGSATFDMTRIVTGQLDAYVDIGRRVADEVPQAEQMFRAVGEGAVCTNFPYDVAAAALVVQEAGGVVTLADGRPVDDRPAVGSGDGYGLAVVASASRPLHELLLDAVERGMERLRAWLAGPGRGAPGVPGAGAAHP
ncbi:MAG: inositol monophosphatase [Acidimicrobiia bacterium]|nr:MAG: inositol monophosphatase [Acidimicrobiia bacterium]